MTTAYELNRKLEETKAARRRIQIRFGDPAPSTRKTPPTRQPGASTPRQSTSTKHETASTQRERDLSSMKVLRTALDDPDLAPSARQIMTNSLRRVVRSLEGKTDQVSGGIARSEHR